MKSDVTFISFMFALVITMIIYQIKLMRRIQIIKSSGDDKKFKDILDFINSTNPGSTSSIRSKLEKILPIREKLLITFMVSLLSISLNPLNFYDSLIGLCCVVFYSQVDNKKVQAIFTNLCLVLLFLFHFDEIDTFLGNYQFLGMVTLISLVSIYIISVKETKEGEFQPENIN